jgi:hypothetical protein
VVNISSNGTYSTDGQPISKAVATDGMIFRLATSGHRIQVNLGDSLTLAKRIIIDEDTSSDDLTAVG